MDTRVRAIIPVVSESTTPHRNTRPFGLAIFLIIAGIIGLLAAFELTLDKFAILANPQTQLNCNINVLVGCSKNLNSWEGNLFGFPNAPLGLIGWSAVIVVAAGILAGARYARWYWLIFNLGVVLALALVIFLITASVTDLRVLCPWCMVTWSVTIPTFWAVTIYNLKEGNIPLPAGARKFFRTLYSWVPLITLVSYLIVALIAQLQLDWIHRAFI